MPLLFALVALALSPMAHAGGCDGLEGDAYAQCLAKTTGSVELCNAIENHDQKLYCYGLGRKSASACRQIMNDDLVVRCLEEITGKTIGETKEGVAPPSIEAGPRQAKSVGLLPPVGADCNTLTGDKRGVCLARVTGSSTHCSQVQHHEVQLYCFGVAQRSRSACVQIYDLPLEQACLAEIGLDNEAASTGVHRPAPTGLAILPPNDPTLECRKLSDPDQRAVCAARQTGDVNACVNIGHHDAKLYCYGITRRSRSACTQVQNDDIEALCLREIGAQ